jgi:hypothetical protein
MSINKYEEILASIKDEEVRKIYKEITSENLHEWNLHLVEMVKLFSNDSYKEISKDSYLNSMLISTPENWVFYLKDEDFLSYIHSDWQSVKKTVFDFNIMEIYNSNSEPKEKEYQIKNINKVKKIIAILNKMYPDRFVL